MTNFKVMKKNEAVRNNNVKDEKMTNTVESQPGGESD